VPDAAPADDKKKKKKKAKKDVAGTDPTAEFDFPDEDPTAGDFDIEDSGKKKKKKKK
jgi:hypothetical protein